MTSPQETHNEQRQRIRKLLDLIPAQVDALLERLDTLSDAPDQHLVLDYLEAHSQSVHHSLKTALWYTVRLDVLPKLLTSSIDVGRLQARNLVFAQDLVVYGLQRAVHEGLISGRVRAELEVLMRRSGT